MQLDYLLFDASEDEAGACSFDAMASVLPGRLATLLAEIAAVLAWAHREFDAPASDTDAAEWDFDLQAADEADAPLEIAFDPKHARVAMPNPPAGRATLALTLSGSKAFADAFRDAFPDSD